MFGAAMGRHRRNGGHCVPGSAAPAPPQSYYPNQDFSGEKAQMQAPGPVYLVTSPVQLVNSGYAAQPLQQVDQRYQLAPQEMPLQPGSPVLYQAQPIFQQEQQKQY
jgi:hypothetical protein